VVVILVSCSLDAIVEQQRGISTDAVRVFLTPFKEGALSRLHERKGEIKIQGVEKRSCRLGIKYIWIGDLR
jgi:hypothetical protein